MDKRKCWISYVIFFVPGFVSVPLAPISAQDAGFTENRVMLQVRPRSEWRDGYKRLRQPGEAGELLTMQRTRLTWYHETEKWEIRLGFQDVRTFGGMAGNAVGYGAFAAAESWGAWTPGENTRITAGRQRIAFDNERIVGAVDWSQNGRFLDGFRWDQTTAFGITTAALTWDAPAGLTRIMGYHVYESKRHRLSFLYFNQKNSLEPSASVVTSGATWSGEFQSKRVSWVVETYAQEQPDDHPTSFMCVAELHYNSHGLGSALVALDWLEGDKRGRAFSPFLGTNHRHYGWMDQFYVGIPANGMVDMRLHWSKPFGIAAWKAVWDFRYHRFYNPTFDELFANEYDAVVVFKPTPFVQASFGWSVMQATEAMYATQNRVDIGNGWQQWGWIALNFSPSIIL
tara:strand:+ start:697 stop:1893 length:1197 start_codon:yes stop_codon:yes gene_type:complete